jgi:hypothetical protein
MEIMNDYDEFEDWSHPTPVHMKIPRHRRRLNWTFLLTWLGIFAAGGGFWYGVFHIGAAFRTTAP